MKKDSTLTAADLDNIVTENFAPDIKKLAHEIGAANFNDPDALQAVCKRIVASYGRRKLWKVLELAQIIYGGDEPLWQLLSGFPPSRKKQPKPKQSPGIPLPCAKLLENEPESIVGPVLDNLRERISRRRSK